ncbi:hypothetical protein EDB81DRAFT_675163 [Dactylonectria macrodidyma]|uniref:DUF676 domain-containing protein n=1 Tax=Dactylonectria macrodidyma TaxID=307937 RepID=A0A9P9FW59_9HYPO|nr:hypothetical protein EDB81DRAFT_675163 [Dactylonectria macrodidyma]
MPRTLLLCFIHGFKGTDNTFYDFPFDLKKAVAQQLPDDRVESVVYPQYETKGELAEASAAFLDWLRERVMEIRKEHSKNPWPPNDNDVGVVLVAHSMGGFVASDSLFLALNDRASNDNNDGPIFPPIQGILTFDTPYNGLARSMFVYGAFSNYSKVSSVFNVMTALSAAAPAGLARLGARGATAASVPARGGPRWKAWQLVAVKTGTVGAIAAGGVAAYMNREAIMKGMRSINKESVVEGYRHSIDALGQGLAYINRGNVGKSFAWLSDHFTFVGALLKQKELNRRIERMGALKGVGIHDFYCSLGENGYWSGGYFVPERTFCAVPEESHAAYGLFSRRVLSKVDDEIQAHLSMFRPEKHPGYDRMTEESAVLVKEWFQSEEAIFDDPKFQETPGDEAGENAQVTKILEEKDETLEKGELPAEDEKGHSDEHPDESPIDIAAAASLVPLPSDEGELIADASTDSADNVEKQNYLNHLFQVAQQAGTGLTGVKSWLPNKIPQMPNMPNMPTMPNMPNMPSLPSVPASMSSLSQVSIPNVNPFSKKDSKPEDQKEEKTEEAVQTVPAEKSEKAEKQQD